MVLSMTGYGQSSREVGNKNYRIEIKSLNGKTTDIRFKSTLNLKDKELELRKLIMDTAQRGKFDVTLVAESDQGNEEYFINKNLMQIYLRELRQFAQENGIEEGDMLQSIIRLPNIVQLTEAEIDDSSWEAIKEMCLEALGKLQAFRKQEGKIMSEDILLKVANIREMLSSIDVHEASRIDGFRERIRKNLQQYLSKENVDENRFEQEIVFYLEKLDINEEKVRLDQHCKYFEEQVRNENELKGKKLSFISQEIGREINTLGAKAQHPEIQQIVVQMKDDLEKVKEQILNIL